MMKLKSGLVVEALPDGGCLIVDEAEKKSHSLRPEAALVWRSLESGVAETELPAATGLEPAVVATALSQIDEAGLLAGETAESSRREWLVRAAAVAGAAVGLKLVETIVTPSPAAAQSLVIDGNQTDG
jgi:hypothetical protein